MFLLLRDSQVVNSKCYNYRTDSRGRIFHLLLLLYYYDLAVLFVSYLSENRFSCESEVCLTFQLSSPGDIQVGNIQLAPFEGHSACPL